MTQTNLRISISFKIVPVTVRTTMFKSISYALKNFFGRRFFEVCKAGYSTHDVSAFRLIVENNFGYTLWLYVQSHGILNFTKKQPCYCYFIKNFSIQAIKELQLFFIVRIITISFRRQLYNLLQFVHTNV